MKIVSLKNNISSFLIISLLIFLLHTLFLIYSGYFEIGLLADDYLNFIGATNSTINQKLTSSIPYINNLHFRPLYYLSIDFSLWINRLLSTAKDNFILFRIENLIFFYTLIFLSSYLLFRITKKIYIVAVFLLMYLLYPNNLNDICWTVGKNDLLCGVLTISSLIFTFKYLENKSKYNYYMAALFFSMGLLTKETSVILPFITILIFYLANNKGKVYELKNLIGLEIFMLLIYSSFRIYILDVQPAEVVTRFQRPGILSSIGVTFKAFISMIIPYDFLSIQNYLNNYNFVFTIYVFLIMIFFVGIVFIFVRTNNFKYIILLSLIFLVTISPNLIAGYFRPQLILIPFLFFTFSLLVIAGKMRVNLKFYIVTLVLIIILWVKLSFDLIQDWKHAYQKAMIDLNGLIELNLDSKKRNVFIGLPSRYNQSYMLDYVVGAYNYRKYGEFKINDKITDLVLTGALDEGSLYSEIKINKLSNNEYELFVTGETQYFLRVDGTGNKYKDNDIAYRLSENNLFKKPTILQLRMRTDSIDIYILSGDKFIKLNE